MDIQEIFNTVAPELVAQGVPSKIEGSMCVLRGDHNRKCAVGFLIPNDRFDASMEEFSDLDEIVQSNGDYEFVDPSDIEDFCQNSLGQVLVDVLGPLDEEKYLFLTDLQNIHDNIRPESWRKELISLASYLGLSTEALTTHTEETAQKITEAGNFIPGEL